MKQVHVYSSNFPLSLKLNLGEYFQLIQKNQKKGCETFIHINLYVKPRENTFLLLST